VINAGTPMQGRDWYPVIDLGKAPEPDPAALPPGQAAIVIDHWKPGAPSASLMSRQWSSCPPGSTC
jgi:hypothetical protein